MLVINLDFCGDWAGSVFDGGEQACEDFVKDPANIDNLKDNLLAQKRISCALLNCRTCYNQQSPIKVYYLWHFLQHRRDGSLPLLHRHHHHSQQH